jgi:hypothetical protein
MAAVLDCFSDLGRAREVGAWNLEGKSRANRAQRSRSRRSRLARDCRQAVRLIRSAIHLAQEMPVIRACAGMSLSTYRVCNLIFGAPAAPGWQGREPPRVAVSQDLGMRNLIGARALGGFSHMAVTKRAQADYQIASRLGQP